MIRGKYDQGKCQSCHSWHFAITLDKDLNPTVFKCCRCGRLIENKIKRLRNEKE